MEDLVHNTVLALLGFEISVFFVIYMCIAFLDKDFKFSPAREWAAKLHPLVWLLILAGSMLAAPWPLVLGDKNVYFELFCPPLIATAMVGIYSFLYADKLRTLVNQQ